MSSDKNTKVLGPDLLDTRLRNQFLKTGKINSNDVQKSLLSLPDDSEWATWIPLEEIIKDNSDEEEENLENGEVSATH
jgi:hypothetical protein